MSVNKWKDSNIYGNFKVKDLLTSATDSTIVTPASAEFDGPVTINNSLSTYDADFDGVVTIHSNVYAYGADNVFEGTIFANIIEGAMYSLKSNGKIRTYEQTSAPDTYNMIGNTYEVILATTTELTTNTVIDFDEIDFYSSDQYGMYQLNAMVYIVSITTSSDTTNLTSYDVYVNGCPLVPRNTGTCNITTTGTKNIVIMSCPISMTLAIYANTTINLSVNCVFTKTGTGSIHVGSDSYIQITKIA